MKQLITEMKRKFERVPLTEKAKPDYLDFDGDGNKEEPMVNALENAEQCTECEGKGCEQCDGNGYHEKVDEMSTSAGVAPVTGKYFLKKNEVAEAMEKRYERLIEGYGQYVTENPKMSAEAKVNRTIKEAYKKLREIEEAVHNATRLKSESGMTREAFNKSAVKALTEMSNKLKTIAERVRNLNQ